MNSKIMLSVLIGSMAVMMVLSALPVSAFTATPVDDLAEEDAKKKKKKRVNPSLAYTYGGCDIIQKGDVCVAPDPDRDGICNGPAHTMPADAARKAGVSGSCSPDKTRL